jgi:hypothetical protein
MPRCHRTSLHLSILMPPDLRPGQRLNSQPARNPMPVESLTQRLATGHHPLSLTQATPTLVTIHRHASTVAKTLVDS